MEDLSGQGSSARIGSIGRGYATRSASLTVDVTKQMLNRCVRFLSGVESSPQLHWQFAIWDGTASAFWRRRLDWNRWGGRARREIRDERQARWYRERNTSKPTNLRWELQEQAQKYACGLVVVCPPFHKSADNLFMNDRLHRRQKLKSHIPKLNRAEPQMLSTIFRNLGCPNND